MIRKPNCPPSEYSIQFLQGMVDAMALSSHTYGLVKDAYPDKVDAIRSLRLRLTKYLETGNTEYLIDVANFAMIEFMHPSLSLAHFKSEDSGKSPGRVWHDGDRKKDRNND